ncbi:MAG: PA0069 family radical SAM protein [Alphaproteobacteria bacterium]|jgi:DNA repair photolyase|nr:PA0069 family radical SAM protein [Alphaproteobacteria bacterium]HJP22516.1 PA0069 family radical SAM protein [Alphaproteobacteria bacterium]
MPRHANDDFIPSPDTLPPDERRGRGTTLNPDSRFVAAQRRRADRQWQYANAADWPDGETPTSPPTQVSEEIVRSAISRNRSPDLDFDQSLNPYRGCEHGCAYCYARPSHEFLDLSPGLDFETKLWAKPGLVVALARELSKPGYRCQPLALGTNTDCYQPLEAERRLSRQVIELLVECRHPLSIVTKSHLVTRDIDLLAPLADEGLVRVALSLTTLDRHLARRLEPRAATPARRLAAIASLSAAGIPTGVMVAPLIPALTDWELESLLEAAARSGAVFAKWSLLRLPGAVKELFCQWLGAFEPARAVKVMHRLRALRQGQADESRFFLRHKGSDGGTGTEADLIAQRFAVACRRQGLATEPPELDTSHFQPPPSVGRQFSLF